MLNQNQEHDQAGQAGEAIHLTQEELLASQDTAERLRQPSAWHERSSSGPKSPASIAEPLLLTSDQMREREAWEDRLSRPSPWHNQK